MALDSGLVLGKQGNPDLERMLGLKPIALLLLAWDLNFQWMDPDLGQLNLGLVDLHTDHSLLIGKLSTLVRDPTLE